MQYARIVERKAVLRNLIGAAGKIAGIGYEDPAEVQEAIDRAESELFAVSQRRDRRPASARSRRCSTTPTTGSTTSTPHRGEISGVRTGFADLDALTTGPPEERPDRPRRPPSVGKTSFALNFAEHAAVREGKSVGVFSLEMSKEQLVLRLLSSVANIDSQRLRTGFLEEMDFTRLAPAMNALSEAPIYIDDTPNISTMELRTKARRLQAEAGLDLIIVDYLQLMQATTTNRDANRVQEVSRDLPRAQGPRARAVRCRSIALSQLSRQPEMRESKEPRLSDLRESGAIEQDADLVMFLWRDKERGARRRRTRRARSSTSSWPSTATARPARSSSTSGSARPGSCPTPASATRTSPADEAGRGRAPARIVRTARRGAAAAPRGRGSCRPTS